MDQRAPCLQCYRIAHTGRVESSAFEPENFSQASNLELRRVFGKTTSAAQDSHILKGALGGSRARRADFLSEQKALAFVLNHCQEKVVIQGRAELQTFVQKTSQKEALRGLFQSFYFQPAADQPGQESPVTVSPSLVRPVLKTPQLGQGITSLMFYTVLRASRTGQESPPFSI